ncbi:MAG: hypothetical protein JW986_07465 [Methanotrichaceae archaeon]|nr:hypothetical protein [Methanotrichaceae archaeon]
MGLAYAALGEHRRAIDYAWAAISIHEAIASPHAEAVRRELSKWHG